MFANFFVNSQMVWKDVEMTYRPAKFKTIFGTIFDPKF